MNKKEKDKLRNSPEMKRKIDEFLKEKLDMNYEDLRVDNPNKKQGIMGFFEILDIEEREIGIRDLDLDMPFIVERNKIFDASNLRKGDLIWAKIFSIPEDGITNEWNFEEIEKPVKGKSYKSGNY